VFCDPLARRTLGGAPLEPEAFDQLLPLRIEQKIDVIPGAISRDEVLANARGCSLGIPADPWAELKLDGLLHRAAPAPGAA
jgi:hypothetical protein